jgi:hypothetical protein
MLALRTISPVTVVATLFAALVIAGLGTSLGLAAATLNGGESRQDGAIQLVHPFSLEPELDRANHDQANH